MAEEDQDYIPSDQDIRAAVRLHLSSERWQKRLLSLSLLTPGQLRAHQNELARSLLITIEPDDSFTEKDIMYAEARYALEDSDFTGDGKVMKRTVDILLDTLQGYVDRRVKEVFQPETLTPEIAAAAPEQFDPEPDAPLSLAEAVCLPELGGILFRHIESVPSATVKEKTLKRAIDRGQLAVTSLNSKNIYVTRRQVQNWIALCQDIKKNPISSNVQHATTKQASSHTLRHGTSTMEKRERARDAALMILKELK